MFDVDGLDWPNHGLPKSPIPGPNQVLAQQMGIVVGQSHHEPMARNKPEWDLEGSGDWDWRTNQDKMRDWWTYGAARAKGMETTFTMGMRGDGDRPLVGASKELLEGEWAVGLGDRRSGAAGRGARGAWQGSGDRRLGDEGEGLLAEE